MVSRLPITFAQLKAKINSEKLKNKIRELLYSLHRSKKVTKTVYNSLIQQFNTNEPHRFRLTLVGKLNLKDPNKNIALASLSTYYTWTISWKMITQC